jgi:CubicO group peptidase (beta-lactamase class C family)
MRPEINKQKRSMLERGTVMSGWLHRARIGDAHRQRLHSTRIGDSYRRQLNTSRIAEAHRRRMQRGNILVALAILVICTCSAGRASQVRYPGAMWARYASPEEAGWSSEGLLAAKDVYDEIGSDAFLAVFDGAVLVAWGDIERRYMCHSVRKSFLSALIGIYVEEGSISLEKTLEELNIQDDPPLTKQEKEARVLDLLVSRSGVYHAAAYETPGMKGRRPPRGSHGPNEFWYYNNWDFNALCTIFEQETGARIFEAFEKDIADPIEMQDFRIVDTYYHLEKQHSIHPAYPFRMSARDMARFGLLYLRQGTWRGRSIVPREWVSMSRRAYSKAPDRSGLGYGYLWWVNTDEADRKFGMYMALGYGGHMIAVMPHENLVLVHRSNTYLNETVGTSEILRLVDAVLDAKVSQPRARPRTALLESRPPRAEAGPESAAALENCTGLFRFDTEELFDATLPYVIGDMIGQSARIEVNGRRLIMTDNLGQMFFLVPRSPTECLVEEMEVPLLFEMDDEARASAIILDGRPAWRIRGVRIDPCNASGEDR